MSDSESGEGSDDDSGPEEFHDGYGEDLIGDEEDRKRLQQMTEKEREQEIFNRFQKREILKTRFVFAIYLLLFFWPLFVIFKMLR